MVKIAVKWQKETFDVDVDTSQPPAIFKFQMYSLTGVPPERQKIMVKGGTLKDDSDWGKVALKEGQRLMMMGTADKIPEAPKTNMVFMEDLPEDEQDVSGLGMYGAGLKNLGNTCYMNSTLQCLYRVKELRQALQGYSGQPTNASHKLAVAAKDLFADLERSAEPVLPFRFLLQLREKYPQFAQQQPNTGLYMQQDAEECWTQLLYSLREALQAPASSEAGAAANAAADPVVQQLMGVDLRTELRCEETGETSVEDSTSFELKCNITIDVNHLSEGLRLGLQEDREKNSEQLGRLALFKGTSKITRLPPYMTVQLVRFFYKRDVQQKSKILRKVNFPLVLDLYEFCSDEYKAELDAPRAAYQAVEDVRVGLEKKAKDAKRAAEEAAEQKEAKESGKKRPLPAGSKKEDGKAKEDGAPGTSATESGGDVAMKDANEPSSSGVDVSAHIGKLTGRYELVAVLTHKGRSADSGHYVSWAKQDDKSWVQFDDEDMIPQKEDKIVELSGGGDWHMAYLLLYRAIRVTAAE